MLYDICRSISIAISQVEEANNVIFDAMAAAKSRYRKGTLHQLIRYDRSRQATVTP